MKHVIACIALLLLPAAGTALADNDNFADAIDITGNTQPYVFYVPAGGTAEPGEPPHDGSPAASSRWYKWTAGSTQPASLVEYGNPSRISIYTGSTLATLTSVAEGSQLMYFHAVAGQIYHIAIDNPDFAIVSFRTYPVGGADDIADAEPVTGTLPLTVHGNNIFATADANDPAWYPNVSPNTSVWWVWTAPASGAIRIDTRLCTFGPMITVYERVPGGSPVQVQAGVFAAGLPVTAGNDYLITVDTAVGVPGEINLWMEWIPTTPPPNDNLANATNLGSADIACDGAWLRFATPESGAPNENPGFPDFGIPGDYTAWWKWTSPHTASYRFSEALSDGRTTINVYAGSPTSGSLVTGAEGFNQSVIVATTAGTTYWVQLKGSFASCTRAELSIYPEAASTPYFPQFAARGIFRLMGSQRLPDADPDGDSFSNQIEFACGANPQIPNPGDPQLPHLQPDGSGGWKLRWREDTSYTSATSGGMLGIPLTLRALTATSPAGPWNPTTTVSDPVTEYKTAALPAGNHGFARLQLQDPNLAPPP